MTKKYNENYYHTIVMPIYQRLTQEVEAYFADEAKTLPSNAAFKELAKALGLRYRATDLAFDLVVEYGGMYDNYKYFKEYLSSLIRQVIAENNKGSVYIESLYAVYVNFFGRDSSLEMRMGIYDACREAHSSGVLFARSEEFGHEHPCKAWEYSLRSRAAYDKAGKDLFYNLVHALFEYGYSRL